MGILDLFKRVDINVGVDEYMKTPGAVLLDVRSKQEYIAGHIKGSKNIPLDEVAKVANLIKDKATPIYVHCLSGGRSMQATGYLKRLGYQNVKNIGGISNYSGKIVI